MNLTFSSFADAGDLSKERLILKVASDIPLGDYVVFLSGVSTDGKPFSGKQTAFWFPDGDVKAGDLVVLYTKSGERSTKTLEKGGTAHFFYWGLTKSVWAPSGGNGAVVLRSTEWQFRAAAK